MLFLFSACLMYDLAGDSVYQETDTDMGVGAEPESEPAEEPPAPSQIALNDVEYSEADGLIDDFTITVEVSEDRLDVVHTNIDLACDMSPYVPEVQIQDKVISVKYMPLNEERDCLMNVEFSMNLLLEEGTYTLILMEDETEFVYE